MAGHRSVQPNVLDLQALQLELTHDPSVHTPAKPLAVAHAAPSFPGANEQPAAVHVSVVHGLPSSHASGGTFAHTPLSQRPKPLQTSPRAHCGPVNGRLKHPTAGSQPSVVHTFPSSHIGGGSETH